MCAENPSRGPKESAKSVKKGSPPWTHLRRMGKRNQMTYSKTRKKNSNNKMNVKRFLKSLFKYKRKICSIFHQMEVKKWQPVHTKDAKL